MIVFCSSNLKPDLEHCAEHCFTHRVCIVITERQPAKAIVFSFCLHFRFTTTLHQPQVQVVLEHQVYISKDGQLGNALANALIVQYFD
jgi:hypothetical protein